MLEHENVPGVVESLKITTAANTRRLVHYAFQYAERNGRKKVTLVHKAVSTNTGLEMLSVLRCLKRLY